MADGSLLCLGRFAKTPFLSGNQEKSIFNNISTSLDIDKMGASFTKYAGYDNKMDKREFDMFTNEQHMTRSQSEALWHILDHDKSGIVDKGEFKAALHKMQQARAWMRYCPTCIYASSCSYCLECNSECDKCSDLSFCDKHWAQHPALNKQSGANGAGVAGGAGTGPGGAADAAGPAGKALPPVIEEAPNPTKKLLQAEQERFGSREFLRHQLVIRPLDWAYHSESIGGALPLSLKQKLRVAMRDQQLRAEAEAERMLEEQEQAKQHADAMIGLNRNLEPIPGLLEGGGLGGVTMAAGAAFNPAVGDDDDDDDPAWLSSARDGRAPWENK